MEKAILKKISRKNTPNEYNVLYLITCEELETNRKYIIGKTVDLLNRKCDYEKMSNCKVIYSKTFNNIKDTEMAEKMVLHLLEDYKEQMNHDRFILPVDKDISLFKNVIDDVYKCFIK